MTTQEMLDVFDILQDKYNAPWFEETEKLYFLNRAQIMLVHDTVRNTYSQSVFAGERGAIPLSSFESTQLGSEAIQPLIFPELATAASATGEVTFANITAQIVSKSGTADSRLMYVIGVQRQVSGSYRVVRFARHNDYYKFKQNSLKAPTERNSVWRQFHDRIKISPASSAFSVQIDAIKYPRTLSISPVANSDLPDYTHDKIVHLALELAMISTRDIPLAETNQRHPSANANV